MARRTTDDRRDPSGVAVTPGSESDRRPRFAGDHLELPIILAAAIEATGTGLHAFLVRLQQGSIWQDGSVRSADGGIEIQAYLAPEGLRSVIRIGKTIWYHHPLGALHVQGILPPRIDIGNGVPLACILPHELLDTIPIVATRVTQFNCSGDDAGVCIDVAMLNIRIAWPPPVPAEAGRRR